MNIKKYTLSVLMKMNITSLKLVENTLFMSIDTGANTHTMNKNVYELVFEIKELLLNYYNIKIQPDNHNSNTIYQNDCVIRNFYSKNNEIDTLFEAFDYIAKNINDFLKD